MPVQSKSYSVFDCDAHINDPIAIWENYLPEKDKELVRDHGYWSDREYRGLGYYNGRRVAMNAHHRQIIIGSCHSGAGMNPQITRALRMKGLSDAQLDELEARGAFDPWSRLQEMDQSGIDQVLVIPTQLNGFFPFVDNIYAARAVARAYNDWAADYCKAAPQRLFAAALIPLQFGPFAADEVYRAAAMGFKVVLARPIDAHGRYPTDPGLLPFWQACEETGLVVGMHTFPSGSLAQLKAGNYPVNEMTGTMHSPGEITTRAVETSGMFQGAHSQDLGFIWESMVWTNGILLSGFLDRFPNLKMAIFESNATWLPALLEETDRAFKLMMRERRAGASSKRLPSEAFRQQMVIAFEGEERPVFRMWDYYKDIGIWSSDHYHHDAMDAWSAIDEMAEVEVPHEAQQSLMGGNARRFYGIEPMLFVTDRRPITHPQWWPTEDEVRECLKPEAAVQAMRRGTMWFANPFTPPPLHKQPQQYLSHHLKKPLDRLS